MKKIICLVLASLPGLIAFNAFGQTQNSYLGIKAGLSIPNLSANGSKENPLNTGYSSRLGPDFVIFFEQVMGKTVSFMPSIGFSSQGGKKNGPQAFPTPAAYASQFPPGQAPTYLYADYKSEAKMNYLMLGALGKFNWQLGSGSPASFYLDAGPFVALLLSAHQVTSGSSVIYNDPGLQYPLPGGAQSFDAKNDIKPDLHKGNFGVEGDIGFALNLPSGKIFIEGGANYGLLNIQKGSANGKNETGAATIRLGYAFHFGMPMKNAK